MQQIDKECINTLRFLAADEVEKAKSGHPGFPLGTAPLIYVIWDRYLRYNPENPNWFDRDRFILSPGHGSALLYAMLHLSGYKLSLSDLQNFRQWGSLTPGHPEVGHTPGVEATTGPLGHGFAMGVGFAIAESMLSAKYNKPDFPIINHYTYGIVSDGDLMEGVASEAASLAGTLGLGKLIYFYDDNKISIEGSTDSAFREDVETRFKAYGWQVLRVAESEDVDALTSSIRTAQSDKEHPTLIIVRTHIGFGSPKQDNASCHGEPLGAEALAITKANAGWEPDTMFVVPDEVKGYFADKLPQCRKNEEDWNLLFQKYYENYPKEAMELHNRLCDEFSCDIDELLACFANAEKAATREASGEIINKLAELLPAFVGGSADLGPSNKTIIKTGGYFSDKERTGKNLHFGVREHGMGAVVNGISLHGGFIPFGGTFAVFADFMRPAIRMAALMKQGSIFVLTHDSIALGEDGPTHQPIETIMALRLIPNVSVFRPADALETAVAWRHACLNRKQPTCLLLSRQKLPVLHEYLMIIKENAMKGGYVISPANKVAQAIIIATGSEVSLSLKAQKELAQENIDVAVVSMPSWDLFEKQSGEYKLSVLPKNIPCLAVEAGTPYGWERYADKAIGITTFGASAPGDILMEKFGFTVTNIVGKIKELLHR